MTVLIPRMFKLATILLEMFLASGFAAAQPAAWHDGLADKLEGNWKVEGTAMGKPAHYIVEADWLLNGQFLRLHEETARDAPVDEKRYDALWFLGYDPISKRYVLHLMDIYGMRSSQTLGYGTRSGNEIRFVFNCPDGPFHATWIIGEGSVRWRMEQKGKDGKWNSIADLKLTRYPDEPSD
jgi:hypothetical protein